MDRDGEQLLSESFGFLKSSPVLLSGLCCLSTPCAAFTLFSMASLVLVCV